MGGGVVHHHVHLQLFRHLPVDEAKELDELLGPVTWGQVGNHLPGSQVESGIEIGYPEAAVVMGLAGRDAGKKGQDGSGAIQSLDLGLLVHAEHEGRVGRVEVEAHDVSHLVDELKGRGRA